MVAVATTNVIFWAFFDYDVNYNTRGFYGMPIICLHTFGRCTI